MPSTTELQISTSFDNTINSQLKSYIDLLSTLTTSYLCTATLLVPCKPHSSGYLCVHPDLPVRVELVAKDATSSSCALFTPTEFAQVEYFGCLDKPAALLHVWEVCLQQQLERDADRAQPCALSSMLRFSARFLHLPCSSPLIRSGIRQCLCVAALNVAVGTAQYIILHPMWPATGWAG